MSLCYFWILGQIIIHNFRCFSCSLRSFEVIMNKIIQLRSKVKLKCNSTRRRCNKMVTDVLPFLILWGLWTMTDSEEGMVLKPSHRTLFLANSPFQIKLSSVPCTILLHFTRIITCDPPTQTHELSLLPRQFQLSSWQDIYCSASKWTTQMNSGWAADKSHFFPF